ncbi:hypothetical protein V060_02678, partial [Staphylococcus aureus R0294]
MFLLVGMLIVIIRVRIYARKFINVKEKLN